MIRSITPLVLTVALLLLLPSLSTSAQATDTSLLLPGAAVDSITGGRPSVMIRKTTNDDLMEGWRHAVEIDPVISFGYTTLSYHYALLMQISLGGKIHFTPGFLGTPEDHSIIGAGPVLRVFPFSKHMAGLFLHTGLDINSGSYDWEYFDSTFPDERVVEETTFTQIAWYGDIGWRYAFRPFYLDVRLGGAKPLKAIDNPKNDVDGETDGMRLGLLGTVGGTDFLGHGGFGFGFTF